MELNHRFTVAAPIDVTWAAFNDLERVAPCFPGATLTSVNGDDFSGSCKVKLGPIALQYTGSGLFVERDMTSYRAVIEAKGRDKRGNGTAGARVTAQLTADGDGTLVEVVTDLSVTGKPAQFGRGVMQDVSDRLLDQFVACLQEELAGESAAAAEPEVVAPAPVDSAGLPPRAAAASGSPTHRSSDASVNVLALVGPAVAKRVGPLAALLVVWLVVRRLRRFG
jgi:carbon monoxide dehydrogenase subunit G